MPDRPRASNLPQPVVIAHRGWSSRAPENTLAAFALAADAGFGIELDATLTADGVVVVLHDETLDRTTSGTGRLDAHDVAALSDLSAGAWFNPPFPDERVPTLAQVLDLIGDRVPVDVEIKTARRQGRWSPTQLADGVADVLAGRGANVFVTSFHPFVLGHLRRRLPHLHRGQLFSTFEDTDLALPARVVLRNLWLNRVSQPDLLVAEQHLLVAGAVGKLRRSGHPVLAWTVNDPDRARILVEQGVSGIITDVPELIADALGVGGR